MAWDALAPGLLLTGAVALLLLAAKTHGRQVRLEREHAGYFDITFGGDNPDFVEALWRRDRRRFWTAAPLAAVGLGVLAMLAPARGAFGASRLLLAPLVGGPVVAFILCGLASLASLRRASRGRSDAWAHAARRGDLAWWSATLLLATAVTAFALAA